MTNKMATLTKQAKERWQLVPPAEQKELIAELKSGPPGSAVIELDIPKRAWPDNHTTVKGRVVSIIFGMDIARGSDKRYLFLSDIPPQET